MHPPYVYYKTNVSICQDKKEKNMRIFAKMYCNFASDVLF